MKAKYLWLVLTTLVLFGCDDNTGGLGMNMLPDSDGITVGSKTFPVTTESAHFENYAVFAKTDIGYVGRFTDYEHGFGYYEGSFLTELNCVDSLTFPKAYNPVSNRDSLNNMAGDLDEAFHLCRLVLGYYSFFGDSLSPMEVSVYQLEKNLDKIYYTNIDPNQYTENNKTLLGKKSFSAVNLADSSRHVQNYRHTVSIPMDAELGKRIIRENWSNSDTFIDSETFREFFKGLFITSEVGDGTVLYVQLVQLDVVFKSYQLDAAGDIQKKYNKDTGKYDSAEDSTYLAYRSFASTMEVIQTNQIDVPKEIIDDKVKETDHTYLKSPAGIYTKAILPIGEIINKEKDGVDLAQDTINSVKLVFNAYHHDIKNEYSMSPPASVLLIREKEAKDFFKNNELPNSTTSYIANYDKNQYTFTNIMRLVTLLAKEMEKEKEAKGSAWNEEVWLKENAVAIIPVTVSTVVSNNVTTITNVKHDLKPAYVKLKGGKDTLNLQVVYSRFNK